MCNEFVELCFSSQLQEGFFRVIPVFSLKNLHFQLKRSPVKSETSVIACLSSSILKTDNFPVNLPKKRLVGLVVSPTLGEAQFSHTASTLYWY